MHFAADGALLMLPPPINHDHAATHYPCMMISMLLAVILVIIIMVMVVVHVAGALLHAPRPGRIQRHLDLLVDY